MQTRPSLESEPFDWVSEGTVVHTRAEAILQPETDFILKIINYKSKPEDSTESLHNPHSCHSVVLTNHRNFISYETYWDRTQWLISFSGIELGANHTAISAHRHHSRRNMIMPLTHHMSFHPGPPLICILPLQIACSKQIVRGKAHHTWSTVASVPSERNVFRVPLYNDTFSKHLRVAAICACFPSEPLRTVATVDIRAEASCGNRSVFLWVERPGHPVTPDRNFKDLSLLPTWFSEDVWGNSSPTLHEHLLPSFFYHLLISYTNPMHLDHLYPCSPTTPPGPPTAPSQPLSLPSLSLLLLLYNPLRGSI